MVDAAPGEFEAGFGPGGQTREHVVLLRALGVQTVICVVNKMDLIEWSQERFDEIVVRLKKFLKKKGFKDKNTQFIPGSGFTGANLIEPLAEGVAPWYTGQSISNYLT